MRKDDPFPSKNPCASIMWMFSSDQRTVRPLRVRLDGRALANGQAQALLAELRDSLKPGRDEIRVAIDLQGQLGQCEIALPGRYDTSPPSRGVLSTIDGVLSVDDLAA